MCPSARSPDRCQREGSRSALWDVQLCDGALKVGEPQPALSVPSHCCWFCQPTIVTILMCASGTDYPWEPLTQPPKG